MMKATRVAAFLFFLATSLGAAEFPAVGQAAPAFRLQTQASKPLALSDLRGKWVVLYFDPRDFTSGCTLQAQNFQRDLAKYKKRNATIVGVSVDTSESHQKFCAKESLSFKLLSDPDAKVSGLYNSIMEYEGAKLSARNTFLIDPQGKVARVFPGVKPAGHSAEVLAALDELRKR